MLRATLVSTVGITLLLSTMTGCDSSLTEITGPLEAPQDFHVVVDETYDGMVTLAWSFTNNLTHLAGFYLYRSSSGVNGTYLLIDTLGASARGYRDIGLDYDSVYAYTLQAFDDAGEVSPFADSVEARPININYPTTPQGIMASAHNFSKVGGTVEILVQWLANSDPDFDHYVVYRDTSPVFYLDTLHILTTTVNTAYTDTQVSVGQRYYYRLVAVDRGGLTSNPSGLADDIPLEAPVLISPIGGNQAASSTPIFQWNRVEEATRYQISLSTSLQSGEFFTAEITQPPSGSLIYSYPTSAPTLASGETYYWRVGAYSQDEREEINSYSVTTSFRVP